MKEEIDPIRKAIDSRYPVIYIQSAEEERVVGRLRDLAREHYAHVPVRTWTCTRGFDHDFAEDRDCRDPLVAIQTILEGPPQGFYVLKDLAPFLKRPEVARGLRDAYFALSDTPGWVILVLSPELAIPPTLERSVRLIQMASPEVVELERVARSVMSEYTDKELPANWFSELALSLTGLTLDEARHVLHGVLSTGRLTRDLMLDGVKREKMGVASGSAFLQYVPRLVELEGVGGLPRIKNWIVKRAQVFSRKTLEVGLPVPKGILIMGISGCGKSLCSKLVAHTWRVPLFRLDMNLVYSSLYGTPEATFDRALRLIESLAPAVLWIDEIENGLGIGGERRESSDHILSAFLTWMQEKPPLIFVAATANRIEALPAELIRKGRFDQVFFCDLPDEQDREEIFRIHVRRNQGDPADFDLAHLVMETKDWNAAEIEQAVIAGRIDAAQDRRAFATDDVLRHCRIMVPLSRTMSEQIKFIRDWAWDRATPAGKGRELELSEPADLHSTTRDPM
ncbi:MAG: AAA family ATPase [Chromatiaceae bacterium]|nr:AAA family ATPase [Chromatiaceae bacterium]